MLNLKFADTHNMVVFLEKPTESAGFEEIVDFLNANPIKYALTINPTIYTSCIEQFWDTAKAKTVNGEVQLHALVDGKKRLYIAPSHTKKIFGNIRRVGKDFSGRVTPLFPTMMVQAQQEQGEGSAMPTDPQHTPTITQPSTSQPKKTQKPRKPKKKNTEVPQSSGSIEHVADKAVNKEMDDNLEITSLKLRVKKLEKKGGSRTHKLKRLYKVGSSRRVESSDEEDLGVEDASKQGRKIGDIDVDKGITLVNKTAENQGRFTDEDMFGVNDLDGDEVIVDNVDVVKIAEETVNVAATTILVSIASTIPVSAAITVITDVEITLAQALAELKTAKPKAKGIVMQEPGESTTIKPQQQHSKDKGKAIMEEPEKPLKKKDQIRFDEEVALKLQAQMQAELEEEDKLARQRE
ncbi:hypothetical protein Tco_0837733 [Tanacetum coccineum]